MLKPLLASILIACAPAVQAMEPEKSAPDLSETQVQELFGDRLATANRAENLLLLAIAFDHQSKESLTHKEPIGIPFIADAGPGYWVLLFQQEASAASLSTLVNNALIVSFLDEKDHEREKRRQATEKLLEVASNKGYWPAKVYLAERSMERWMDSMATPIPLKQKGPDDIPRAEQLKVFNYLVECSQIGFVPCQIRLGFWYLQSPNQQEAAVELLRAGVEIARRDNRYLDSKETVSDTKAALAVLLNLGLTPQEQADYQNLLGELEQLSKEPPDGNA